MTRLVRLWRQPSVIPGFRITLGVTNAYLCLIVLIPLLTLPVRTPALSITDAPDNLTLLSCASSSTLMESVSAGMTRSRSTA